MIEEKRCSGRTALFFNYELSAMLPLAAGSMNDEMVADGLINYEWINYELREAIDCSLSNMNVGRCGGQKS